MWKIEISVTTDSKEPIWTPGFWKNDWAAFISKCKIDWDFGCWDSTFKEKTAWGFMEQVIRWWLCNQRKGQLKQIPPGNPIFPQISFWKLVSPESETFPISRLTSWSFVFNSCNFRINHTYAELVFMWTSLEKDWGSTFLVVMMNLGCSVQSWATIRLQLLLKEYVWLIWSNVLKFPPVISHVATKQNR